MNGREEVGLGSRLTVADKDAEGTERAAEEAKTASCTRNRTNQKLITSPAVAL